MRRSTTFIVLSLGFIVGVLIGSVWNIEKPWLYVAMAFCTGGFAITYSSKGQSLASVICRYILLGLLFLCLGTLRIGQVREVSSEFTSILNTTVNTEGVIVEEPDVRPDKQLVTVQLDGYNQRVLITTSQFASFMYGDRVWVLGKVVEPKSFDDFDYRGYLERQNVYALMRYPKVIVLKTGQGNSVRAAILKIKALAVSKITTVIPKPDSDLLLGILVGARKGLPQNVTESFIATGTSHIVAVSGFNMSVIIGALAFLARFIGRRTSFWVALVCIAVFTVMAGASASVVRAAIMGLLVLIAMNIGRLYAITPSLLCAAFCMLAINPRILYWDVGFQLSFAATVGIVYGVPVLMRVTERIPNDFGIKVALLVTIAASIATLPLTLLAFGRMSVIAPVANVLVLPFIPLVMLLGMFVLLPWVGIGFGFVVEHILQAIRACIYMFSQVPHAAISMTITATTFWSLVVGVVCLYVVLWYWARTMCNKNTSMDSLRLL